MSDQLPDLTSRSPVPLRNDLFPTARDRVPAVRRAGQIKDLKRMSFDAGNFLTARHLPEADGSGVLPGKGVASIRAEIDSPGRVPALETPRRPPRRQVDEADHLARAADKKPTTVRGKGHRIDIGRPGSQATLVPSALHVPQPDRSVPTGRQQHASARRDREVLDPA